MLKFQNIQFKTCNKRCKIKKSKFVKSLKNLKIKNNFKKNYLMQFQPKINLRCRSNLKV